MNNTWHAQGHPHDLPLIQTRASVGERRSCACAADPLERTFTRKTSVCACLFCDFFGALARVRARFARSMNRCLCCEGYGVSVCVCVCPCPCPCLRAFSSFAAASTKKRRKTNSTMLVPYSPQTRSKPPTPIASSSTPSTCRSSPATCSCRTARNCGPMPNPPSPPTRKP